MKHSKSIIAILAIIVALPTFSQTIMQKVSSAEKLYVTPLKNYNYYGIKLGAGQDKDGSYSISGNFEVGDMLADTDPNVSWEIAGIIPDEVIAEVNDHILKRFAEKFADVQVMAWPEDLYNPTMASYKQKEIETDFYVIVQRAAFQAPVRLQVFEPNTPADKPMIVGGAETITFTLFEKVKAGKKGKKVTRIAINPFKELPKTGISYDNWDDHNAAAAAFCDMATKNLKDQVDRAIDQLFAELDTVM